VAAHLVLNQTARVRLPHGLRARPRGGPLGEVVLSTSGTHTPRTGSARGRFAAVAASTWTCGATGAQLVYTESVGGSNPSGFTADACGNPYSARAGAVSSSDARGASPRARASCGRSRRSPHHVSVAQWRAHLVPNQGVAGSSPAGDTHGGHECRVRNAFVAQWKARLTTNQEVGGSSPSKGTGTARYCENRSAPLAEMALAPGFYPGDGGSSPSRRTCPAGHRVAEMRRPPGTGNGPVESERSRRPAKPNQRPPGQVGTASLALVSQLAEDTGSDPVCWGSTPSEGTVIEATVGSSRQAVTLVGPFGPRGFDSRRSHSPPARPALVAQRRRRRLPTPTSAGSTPAEGTHHNLGFVAQW